MADETELDMGELLRFAIASASKLQKVDRPTNRSYYVYLPVVLAEIIDLQKGHP